MPPTSIIEHLLLLKVRDSTDPSTIAGMLSSLRSLSSLPLFPHLAAGPIRLLLSPPSSSPLLFTHLLHIRFLSQPALSAYSLHPLHLSAVQHNAPIIQDILAVDWAADLAGDLIPSPGSAMLFLIAKPKEGTPPADIVKAVGALKGTCGVNLAPGRAKGYEVGLVLEEAMDGEVQAIEEGIRDLVESVLALEFVVPSVLG